MDRELDNILNLFNSCYISEEEYNQRKGEIYQNYGVQDTSSKKSHVAANGSVNPFYQPPTVDVGFNDYSNSNDDHFSSNTYSSNYTSGSDQFYGTSMTGATSSYSNIYAPPQTESSMDTDNIPVLNSYQSSDSYSSNSSNNNNNNNNNSYRNNNNNNNNKNNNYNRNNNNKYKYVNKNPPQPKVEEPKEMGAFASMFVTPQPTVQPTQTFASMFINSFASSSSSQPAPKKLDITVVGNETHNVVFTAGVPATAKAVYVDLSKWTKEVDNSRTPKDADEALKQQWRVEQNTLVRQLVAGNPKKLSISKTNCNIKYIGGLDISFAKNNKIDACASIVVLEYPSLNVVYESYKMVKLTQPYVAGYLAFREMPHLMPLWEVLVTKYPQYRPDVMVIDGNGINHMRKMGAACHFGVLANVPTIGVAKQLLYSHGITDQIIDDGFKKSSVVEMLNYTAGTGEVLGHAIYNSSRTKIYISPGHMIDAATALQVVQATLNNRPIPESTFQADALSRQFLANHYNKFSTR
ncbi:hypothetical protein CYY_009424 [Polysphondylium violaceum]|uniref:Endonuclease V n=1 Tax=Polysphondylium violaceum TaxID=133409 RepID=A0A8J4V2Z0_9MYCE|nr:hypothetical protein CYY_009424 [Polysphondylium violaceum]